MNIKKVLLVPLTILLGICIGLLLENDPPKEAVRYSNHQETISIKDLRTPKYLSKDTISHKDEDIEHRPAPSTDEERIVAYFVDQCAKQYEKSDEVYEINGTVYTKLKGQEVAIASHKRTNIVMIPKLSASKKYISYTLCSDTNNSCDLVVEYLPTHTKTFLGEAGSNSWHPQSDVLIYDTPTSDDGEVFARSEIYIYDSYRDAIVQMTDTPDFIEIDPIFSEDGRSVYCEDSKTNKLLYFSIYRNGNLENIDSISLYKSKDSSLGIDEIKKRSELFESISRNEQFADSEITYWIEMVFSDKMKSGAYYADSKPFIFDQNSFSQKQLDVNISRDENPIYTKNFSYNFNYQAGVDPTHYYFRLKEYRLPKPFRGGLYKVMNMEHIEPVSHDETIFFRYTKSNLIYTILASIVIGMILMSALYTAVIYTYRDENAFIYYSLMQVSMALFLLTPYIFFKDLFRVEFISMAQLSLIVAFFATLFTQSFLQTKEHLPRLHIVLNIYLLLMIADMIWFFDPLLMRFKLYEIFGLLFLVIAFIRAKDGFIPAWFYLVGWIGLLTAIFLQDFYHTSEFTMYIGVFIEAVMLAWGLVYRRDVLGGR